MLNLATTTTATCFAFCGNPLRQAETYTVDGLPQGPTRTPRAPGFHGVQMLPKGAYPAHHPHDWAPDRRQDGRR